MTKTIGLIGSGMIGGQVARLAVAAGFNVVVSNSRGPETLAGFLSELGDRARAATPDEAASAGDLVVAAIQFGFYKKLSPEVLAGKIVIDAMNYYPGRDGVMPEVKTDTITTSELVQRHLLKSHVVKGLNNMDWIRLLTSARPHGSRDRSAVPIAGDDEAAKAAVSQFIDAIGYDVVDFGGLAGSWRVEPTTPAYVSPYLGAPPAGSTADARRDWFTTSPGVVVPTAHLKTLLDKAVRHDQMTG